MKVNQNVIFTTDSEASIKDSDIIFVCVNTPTKKDETEEEKLRSGKTSDMTYL